MDEPFTIFFAQADLADIFRMLPGENNPPLYFLLLHFWIKIFGISAVSVRFLPLVFSVVTAIVLFRIGQRFFSVKMGIVAALLFTFSNYQMVFAHEARVYSLFALLTACSMYLFMRMRTQPGSVKMVLFYTLVNILLVYSHFFGFLVIGTQLFTLLVLRDYRKTILKQVLISTLLILISFTPYLSIILSRFAYSTATGTWVSSAVVSDLYTMLWRYSNAPVPTVLFILLLVCGFIIFQIRQQRKPTTGSPESKLLLIWFLVPYLFMFLISFKIPVFLDRYTVFISIGYYLVIAMAIESIFRNKWLFGLISAAAVLLMVFTFTPDIDNKRRFSEVTGKIQKLSTPGTMVIICPAWLEYGFAYHGRPDYFMDYKNLRRRLNEEHIFPVNSQDQLDTNVLKKATSVLYLEEWATLVDKDNKILNWLSTRFFQLPDEKVYESFIIHHFAGVKKD